jgi:uncharacterized YigZ family protein
MAWMTVKTEAMAELEAKGSRFIAVLVPLAHYDARLAEIRVTHRKASHHVTATRRMTDANTVEDHASDDGEPAGTSGMPTLKTLMGADLVDAGMIVTRYFGGTKLGTGGLARAYSGAAARAIERAHPVPWHRIVTRTVTAAFADTAALEQRMDTLGLTVIDRAYTEDGVTLTVRGPEAKVADAPLPEYG